MTVTLFLPPLFNSTSPFSSTATQTIVCMSACSSFTEKTVCLCWRDQGFPWSWKQTSVSGHCIQLLLIQMFLFFFATLVSLDATWQSLIAPLFATPPLCVSPSLCLQPRGAGTHWWCSEEEHHQWERWFCLCLCPSVDRGEKNMEHTEKTQPRHSEQQPR